MISGSLKYDPWEANGVKLNHLRFADDIVLSEDIEETRLMIEQHIEQKEEFE